MNKKRYISEKDKKNNAKSIIATIHSESLCPAGKSKCLRYHERFDLLACSLLPKGFEMIELSCVAPLGSNSVSAPVDQNNALSTVRNIEVCSDPTNVLALESAARKQHLKKESNAHHVVKLCSSHRIVRGQKFKEANFFPHFRVLALTTAGKDEGSFKFEIESLYEHISY